MRPDMTHDIWPEGKRDGDPFVVLKAFPVASADVEPEKGYS